MTLLSDSSRLQKLLDLVEIDGYGHWIGQWLIKPERLPMRQLPSPVSLDEFREAIDQYKKDTRCMF